MPKGTITGIYILVYSMAMPISTACTTL